MQPTILLVVSVWSPPPMASSLIWWFLIAPINCEVYHPSFERIVFCPNEWMTTHLIQASISLIHKLGWHLLVQHAHTIPSLLCKIGKHLSTSCRWSITHSIDNRHFHFSFLDCSTKCLPIYIMGYHDRVSFFFNGNTHTHTHNTPLIFSVLVIHCRLGQLTNLWWLVMMSLKFKTLYFMPLSVCGIDFPFMIVLSCLVLSCISNIIYRRLIANCPYDPHMAHMLYGLNLRVQNR